MAIKTLIKDGKLIITADLDGNERSSSGKSVVKASSGGFQPVDGRPDIRYSLNVISK